MARKSRKTVVQQAEPVIQVEPGALATAIYARLSVENSGKNDDGNSLNNQIDVCKDFIAGCPYLTLTEVYADNGKTGTVFDRPAWNRLMEEVRSGKIQCIVVRDLSRFGRDYIEVGNYLEKIFPALGTRFISVKENFDNFLCDGNIESLSVTLQNLVNAMYSRDISKKVSTALNIQMESGTFVNRHLPYGYAWNADKTAYVIDEEAAPYVRKIFQWKVEGVSPYDICERLNTAGIPVPEEHKHQNGQRVGDRKVEGVWRNSSLFSILTNRAYIGEAILRKSERALYKGIKHRYTAPEEQIVTENAHPAIVDRETFDRVQEIMRKASEHRSTKMKESADERAKLIDLFNGILFCGDCGRRIYFKRQIMDYKVPFYAGVYECSTRVRRLKGGCIKKNISQTVLESRVLNCIQSQLQVALDYEKLLKLLRGSAGEAGIQEKHNAAIRSIKIRLNALAKKRTGLYEDYVEGLLDEEEYSFAKQSFENQYEKLNQLLDEAVQRKERFVESISPENKWLSMMRGANGVTKLTQELVDAMIERILLYESGRIEVVFNYHDVFEEMCEGIRMMEQEAIPHEGV